MTREVGGNDLSGEQGSGACKLGAREGEAMKRNQRWPFTKVVSGKHG